MEEVEYSDDELNNALTPLPPTNINNINNRRTFLQKTGSCMCRGVTMVPKCMGILMVMVALVFIFGSIIVLLRGDQESSQIEYKLQKQIYDIQHKNDALYNFIHEKYGNEFELFEQNQIKQRSRSAFTDEMIAEDLARLHNEQQQQHQKDQQQNENENEKGNENKSFNNIIVLTSNDDDN